MNITIELAGGLAPALPRHQTLEMLPGATAGHAAHLLGLNPEQVGLITINGVQSELQDALPPDSRLCFFPYLSGG